MTERIVLVNDPHKLGAKIELDLTTTDHIVYTSKFYFGSQQSAANLVYDSANDWMLVTDKNCDTCTNKIYDPSSSTTANDGWTS
jgi:hypothetical protein